MASLVPCTISTGQRTLATNSAICGVAPSTSVAMRTSGVVSSPHLIWVLDLFRRMRLADHLAAEEFQKTTIISCQYTALYLFQPSRSTGSEKKLCKSFRCDPDSLALGPISTRSDTRSGCSAAIWI